MLLALESATPMASVAVGPAGRVAAEVAVGLDARTAESLLPAVDYVLKAVGIGPDSLDGVVVGGGPGSFTGVRIAAATAKGLVHATGKPLFAYSGLLALAASSGGERRPVWALLDARRDQLYAACYRFPGFAAVDELVAPSALSLAGVLDRHASMPTEPALFVGDGALRHRDAIEAAGGDVAPGHLAVPRAAALLWLAWLLPEQGRVHDPAGWEPEYLRAWR
jgi:tRNA threonylcarbamoyladenosine biosynthesis protein TsaB